jgi:hypothetical protein
MYNLLFNFSLLDKLRVNAAIQTYAKYQSKTCSVDSKKYQCCIWTWNRKQQQLFLISHLPC